MIQSCAPCASGLPEDFSSKDYRPCPGPFCFMEQLCELHDGLVLEAKGVREHFWKPFIKRLFHKRVRAAATVSPWSTPQLLLPMQPSPTGSSSGFMGQRGEVSFKPCLKAAELLSEVNHLCPTQILRGKEDSLTGFLDPVNFGDSL